MREHGKIASAVEGDDTVFTITVYGQNLPVTEDLMDRVLQHTLMELGVDASFKEAEIPPIEPGPVEASPVEGSVPQPTVVDKEHPPEEGPSGPVPGVNIVV